MQIGILSAMAAMSYGYREEAVADGSVTSTGGTAVETPAKTAEQVAAETAAAAEAKAEQHRVIKAQFNNLVDVKDTSFHFRTVTTTAEVDGKKMEVKTKRPTVTLPIPVLSVEGIIAILEKEDNQKQIDLLLEACASVVLEQAREYVNEHEDVNDNNFPYATLSWEAIANMPKAERRGGGIGKETWDEFEQDYIEVMPGVTGKKKEQVEVAAKLFKLKFAGATTNKPVLKVLRDQLAIYATNTTKGEQLVGCIEFLSDKLEKLIETDETNLLKNL
jgi:hypothetical protein